MDPGTINSDLTTAGRVYAYLSHHRGCWIEAWRLKLDTRPTAISIIRHQLFLNERIEVKQDGHGSWYRLVRVPVIQRIGEQLALGV